MSGPVAVAHSESGPAEAPVVVLSSSLGTTREMWRAQVPALAEAFRVVAYDHRGHGASPVPPGPYAVADMGADVVALLDALGVERAHVCGLSLGGMLGMWLGIHHPERVDRLVLCCTFARNVPDAPWDERIASVRAGGVGAVADGVVARWLTPEFAGRDPVTRDWLRGMLAAQPADGYAAACAAVRDMDLLDGLGAIRAPTLVIGGAQDLSAPRASVEAVAAAIPGARLELLEPAAHLANVERADDVTRLIRRHLGD
jgi:3-oxoadipate enol-lactonase